MVGMGMTQGDTLALLRQIAARTLPQGYLVDYAGTSRQYVQESSGFVTLFVFAAIIIFLALAALFESFRDSADHPDLGADVDCGRDGRHASRQRIARILSAESCSSPARR